MPRSWIGLVGDDVVGLRAALHEIDDLPEPDDYEGDFARWFVGEGFPFDMIPCRYTEATTMESLAWHAGVIQGVAQALDMTPTQVLDEYEHEERSSRKGRENGESL